MPRVSAGLELRALTECCYTFPAETLSDLHRVRALHSDLRLYADFYCFPNKEKKKLLYLAGTLPVPYEGSCYNIPVCIWLHQSHPASRPRCYVCPSISMVINPSCPYVDQTGHISLGALNNWSHGSSTLALLVSEMRRAFQADTPLFACCPVQAPPPAADPGSGAERCCPLPGDTPPVTAPGQSEPSREVQARKSYMEELLEINFSVPPLPPSSSSHSNPFLNSSPSSDLRLSSKMADLALDPSGATRSKAGFAAAPGLHQKQKVETEPSGEEPEHIKMAAGLPADRAAMFRSLMQMEGQNFSPSDVMEAVQLNKDLPSAFRFLTHCCPICQDQVSFSKVLTMTHCSCFLCQSCFKSFFSAAIKERSIEQLVCPQCNRPDVKGQGSLENAMDYFNLLDTQVRHFLSPQDHELFQRKLRDRALQEMKSFCWCAHCSFGMLHESQHLRMDCVNCQKSTCSQCRSAWSPEHQGLSCEQFRLRQQQNQNQNQNQFTSIECPRCRCVFSLSRGGCLHFTCSQCQHQFCGDCAQTFSVGSVCGFSEDCFTKGLHAHHPRDCLYHLRDWTVTRLLWLLQFYRGSVDELVPSRLDSVTCLVLVLKDDREEEPCGKPVEHRGYCESHYKEVLVDWIHRIHGDPAALYSLEEVMSELRRWNVAVPTRRSKETEEVYAHRLRQVLTHQLPLRRP